MRGPDEFDRLRDLLGDVCEGAATGPAPEQADAEGGPDRSQGRAAGDAYGAAGQARRRDPARTLSRIWPEVVGADVAANTTPVQLTRGRLVVSTSSSVWAQTLQFMTEDIILGLNERMGPDTVHQVVFRHAGWEDRPRSGDGPHASAERPQAGPSGKLSAEQKQAIADVEKLDLPADIKDRIARAMKAAFVRGEKGSVR